MPSPEPLREHAYRHIRDELLTGRLGAGHVVSEQAIAQQLGMSRTPVREAIQQLQREGVVQQVPRFGTVVRNLDRRDLVELFELRLALEPFAVRGAAGRMTAEQAASIRETIVEVQRIADTMTANGRNSADAAALQELMTADLRFHLELVRANGNRRLAEIVSKTRVLTQIFSVRRQPHDLATIREIAVDHGRILDAVVQGDAALSERLLREHIQLSLSKAQAAFEDWTTDVASPLSSAALDALAMIQQEHDARSEPPIPPLESGAAADE